MRVSLHEYCMAHGAGLLLEQWHPDRNGSLTPQHVSYGSKRKIWWRCAKGHEWQAMVYTRTGDNAGCPYCAGKRVVPGENDLASQMPDIAAQWHPTKNGDRTPGSVSAGSHVKAWWLCDQGHEWRASVKSRAVGTGCPICANRVLLPGRNDLATTHPELARQWHPTKNNGVKPRDLMAGSRRKVWWQCARGHEWQAIVYSRTSMNAGCPVCAGKIVVPGENDLASSFPGIAAEWHPEKNSALTPRDITAYSNRRVWWSCPMGHEYQAIVSTRVTRGTDCPYCAGRRVLPGFNDLAALEPKIAAQWHPTLNGALTPEMVTVGSHKKVWWECPEGHVWSAVIYSRTGQKKTGCPVCAGRRRKPRGVWRYLDADTS